MIKKLFFILITVLILFSNNFCQARELELTYPNIPNAITPVSTRAILPELIIYLFKLAVRISGLVVFGSLVYGGFLYLTSVGDPKRQKDAQDQIKNSFLGLGIILLSYILLQTINPQLVNLGIAKEITTQGIVIFKDIAACNEFKNDTTKYDKLAGENRALKITSSISNLRQFLGDDYKDLIGAVYFFEDGKDLEVWPYAEENWVGKIPIPQGQQANTCSGTQFVGAKSLELVIKPAGVYLCCGATYDADWNCQGLGKEKYLASSTAAFPPECNDNVKGIKIKPQAEFLHNYPGPALTKTEMDRWTEKCYKAGGWGFTSKENNGTLDLYCLYHFGIVLHNNSNFGAECEIFLDGVQDLSATAVIKTKSSSATIFRPIHSEFVGEYNTVPISPGEGVTLYTSSDYLESTGPFSGPIGPYKETKISDTTKIATNTGGAWPGELSAGQGSLKISPEKGYIAILFEGKDYTQRCEVFTESAPEFVGHDIGRCQCEELWYGCHPIIGSLQVYPTR